MGFGIRIRGRRQIGGWLVACAAFALFAAVWSVAQVNLAAAADLPPIGFTADRER